MKNVISPGAIAFGAVSGYCIGDESFMDNGNPLKLTAIVLTKNEEGNLEDCVRTIEWADEILVVDSISTDRTAEIARRVAHRFVEHPFTNFASQHNFAQSAASNDWVFFVDADERVSAELKDEIESLIRSGAIADNNAYHIQRVHLFSGEWSIDVKKRKMNPHLRKLIIRNEVPRLFDRRKANWQRPLHETVSVPEPHGVLTGVLYHYSSTNLSATLKDFNYYTDLEAAYLRRGRKKITITEAVLRGLRNFLYMYLKKGFYRQGGRGFVMAAILAFTKFMNYAKAWELIRIESGRGTWTEEDKKLLGKFDLDHR